jgi:hypothetical protein
MFSIIKMEKGALSWQWQIYWWKGVNRMQPLLIIFPLAAVVFIIRVLPRILLAPLAALLLLLLDLVEEMTIRG